MSTGRIRVLIADDEKNITKLLAYNIGLLGYEAIIARDGKECIECLESAAVNAVLLDLNIPKMNGLEVLTYIKEKYPQIPVIMVTAVHDITTAVKAIKIGAYEYITKPVELDRLVTILKTALTVQDLHNQTSVLKNQLRTSELFPDIIGESKRIKEVCSVCEWVMQREVNVLILGESGTGKELLAQAIHKGGNRKSEPFVPVNCAAINNELADSLLFGHKKGSFTGATEDRIGYFEQADKGTLFLDEVGDMDLDIQAKVLRVLEEKKIRRVGEKSERKIDFRLISATNLNFSIAVAEKSFRKDLYFRLEEYPIHMPSLRERPEDISMLANYFLKDFCKANKIEEMNFSEEVVNLLTNYSWPGNIRELKNVVQRAAIQNTGAVIESILLSNIEAPNQTSTTSETPIEAPIVMVTDDGVTLLDNIEKEAIQQAYDLADGNASEAAKMLGISRATIYRKLKKFKLEKGYPG